MSTRGVIAVGTKSNWRGVFNHFDSYYSVVGVRLQKEASRMGLRALAAFIEEHPDGFGQFPKDPYQPDPKEKSKFITPKDDLFWMEYLYVIDLSAGKIFATGHDGIWLTIYDAHKKKQMDLKGD
jgi:hypothetical protein